MNGSKSRKTMTGRDPGRQNHTGSVALIALPSAPPTLNDRARFRAVNQSHDRKGAVRRYRAWRVFAHGRLVTQVPVRLDLKDIDVDRADLRE